MKTKTRVAHVVTRLCQGGATNVLSTLGKFYDHQNFQWGLFYGQLNPAEVDGASQVTPYYDPCCQIKSLQREVHPFQDVKAFYTLRKEIKEWSADIIHTHTSKAGIIGRLVAASLTIPCVHSTHGHIFKKESLIPSVGSLSRPLFQQIEKVMAYKTRHIFTLSQREIDDLVSLGIAPRDQYQVLPSPIIVNELKKSQQNRQELREKWGLQKNDWVTLHVGRLALEKGHKILIEAMNQGVSGELWLVGEGPLRGDLESLVMSLSLRDRVKFLGHRDDLHQWMALADALVLPSTYEGQGLVLIEAMAAGIPVIATHVGGIPEVVDDKKNGLLVNPHNSKELAEALICLQQDRALVQKLVLEAYQTIDRFHPDKTVQILQSVYQNILIDKSQKAF